MRNFYLSLFVSIFTWFNVTIFSAAKADDFVIGKYEGSVFAPFCEPLIKEAYAALGHTVRFKSFPAKRASLAAQYGTIDGVLLKWKTVSEVYDKLVMVPVPISQNGLVALTRKPDVVVKNWDDLQKYSVIILNGQTSAEKYVKAASLRKVNSYPDLYKRVLSDSVDVAVMPELHAQKAIKKYPKIKLTIQEPHLTSGGLYHVLNRRHGELLPLLTKQLKKMEREGVIAKYNREGRNAYISAD